MQNTIRIIAEFISVPNIRTVTVNFIWESLTN